MKIFNSLKGVATALTWIDIVFFSLIIILILSFVVMIYFMKINKKMIEIEIEEDEKKEEKTYSDPELQNISLTEYEKNQEDQAIISYNELLQKANKQEIAYDETYKTNEDVEIKKIDIHNTSSNNIINYEEEEKYLKSLIELNNKLN